MKENYKNKKDTSDFRAKKSLGQNFLDAPDIIKKMIEEGNIAYGDLILEVGPGKGILTQGLLDAGAYVVAIEKDDRAIPFLKEKFGKYIHEQKNSEVLRISEIVTTTIDNDENHTGKLMLIHGDILEFDPSKINIGSFFKKNEPSFGLPCQNYTIIANIPYYITGEFLRKFLESSCQPKKMVIMLQKEVAERIVASETKESILSISIKAYGKPDYILTVPRHFFDPAPKVDSALISIDSISKDFFETILEHKSNKIGNNSNIEEKFFTVVKAGFAHKRKVVIKNLEKVLIAEILNQLWLEKRWSPTLRAENMKLDDWKAITQAYISLFST